MCNIWFLWCRPARATSQPGNVPAPGDGKANGVARQRRREGAAARPPSCRRPRRAGRRELPRGHRRSGAEGRQWSGSAVGSGRGARPAGRRRRQRTASGRSRLRPPLPSWGKAVKSQMIFIVMKRCSLMPCRWYAKDYVNMFPRCVRVDASY